MNAPSQTSARTWVSGRLCLALLGVLIVCLSGSIAHSDAKRVRRFALIMGANDGGDERILLRYAKSDAEAFSRVLKELGGVQNADKILITQSSKKELLAGFDEIRRRLQNAADRAVSLEMVFYYSGHSDERGLLLGNDILSFKELKKQLDQLPAKVKIGILDSCASGAFVRIKGGRRTAPFLVDTSTEVEGYALLTSSSADENAQESERIGGSFFTHYLISGLRGAADTNRDGRVTLNESYAYAFDETLYRTESSRGGAQHPNYDFQLAGAGDLVLTDLRSTDSMLVIPESMSGRIFVRDVKGRLVAEINKTADRKVSVAVPAGRYEVTVDSEESVRKGYVRVNAGSDTMVQSAQLTTVTKERTRKRGGNGEITYRTYAATVFPNVTTNPDGKVENRLAANVIGAGYSLRGIEVGVIRNQRDYSVHGVQAAILMNRTRHLSGMQHGMVNIATGDIKGAQVGFVNLGGTYIKGAQLGMFNAAGEESNAPQFGFINYMPDGILAVSAWGSDTALYNVGFKMGGRYTFSQFTLGTRAYSDENWFSMGWGFGGHFEAPRLPLWIELDTTFNGLFGDRHDLDALDVLIKTKLTFGVRLYGTLSLFAGPLINTLISETRKTVAVLPPFASGQFDNYHYEMSPGFYGGFQIEPRFGRHNTWKGNLKK
ncbi:MAG: caspase family protein [Deltaproteobacteria bacterium]|nr:caspase family protein [Deltaproteobacteria bacterium]MBN2674619.1 caspase family protein [Deltaproteobacteria bacterium]